MSPSLLLLVLLVMLLAMLPVWRLYRAAWRPGVLFAAWITYTIALFAVVRVPGPARFLVPILVLAYVAPFVAGPERLTRFMGVRMPKPRPVIDVTPKPPPGLPLPRDVTPDDDPGAGDDVPGSR